MRLPCTGVGGLRDNREILFDDLGYMYVAEEKTNAVLRYQGPNGPSPGAFVDQFVSSGLGGLNHPAGMLFDPQGNLLVASRDSDNVLRFGQASQAVFMVTLSAASATPVSVCYTTANGIATAGTDYAAASGTITFAPGETARTVIVQTLDGTVYEGNEAFTVNLSNPTSGAAIVDGQGVGTISDDDPQPTKFYVVNDATTNVTYEYGDNGTALENYSLDSGNAAPRGAASTAAGDKVWVVDANRTVYVYDSAGALLGSWTAGSIASNATVQGIATNGTDVWIVDAKSDKVFRYAGAATRLSGSQNAASSFSLNTGNRDPSDLVVRGSEMWVANNSSTDKVFKYTTSGSLLGSWTISGGGGSPTGITIDPAGGTSIWIVDSGTDRVYQFDNATTRTSGSAAPSTSFALAAGNTNPQGIADPPTASAALLEATPESGLPLGSALVDWVLADDASVLGDIGDDVDQLLRAALAARRRSLEADSEQVDELDRWYATLENDQRPAPARRAAAPEYELTAIVETALPKR
jgi:hypothetical protein